MKFFLQMTKMDQKVMYLKLFNIEINLKSPPNLINFTP